MKTAFILSALAISALPFVCVPAQAAKTFNFDDYWKEGEDGLMAMRKILDLAKAEKGSPTLIKFSKRNYVFPKSEECGWLMLIDGISNLTVDGMGASISIDSYNSFCEVRNSDNIIVRNMNTSHTNPPFTQGDVVAIDKAKENFTLRIHKNYPLLPSDEYTKKTHSEGWRWGSVMDKKSRTIKFGTIDAVFISRVEPGNSESEFVLYTEKRSAPLYNTLEIGDCFAMPVYKAFNPKLRGLGMAHINVTKSADVLFESIKCSGLKHLGFAGTLNRGKYAFKNCSITWKNPEDLISCWRDGSHFKNNKCGPIIEGCRFEGMLDDSINISTAPARITKLLGNNTYEIERGESIFPGCTLGIYYADSGKWITGTKVLSKKGRIITTDKEIENPVLWQAVSNADIANSTAAVRKNASITGLYNLEYLGANYKIKNNYFGIQRRYAAVLRAPHGEISGNTFDSTPGGIWISNEIGGWYEGAIPHDIKISGNTFSKLWRTAIIINMMSTSKAHIPEMRNITVSDNKFVLPGNPGIIAAAVLNGENISFKNNLFETCDGTEVPIGRAVSAHVKAKNVKLEK